MNFSNPTFTGLAIVLNLLLACSSPVKDSSKVSAEKPSKSNDTQIDFPTLPIPHSCLDASYVYQPVKNIHSRTSYLDLAADYQPIQQPNGFIQHDFTHDGKLDYLFIEREKKPLNSSKIRLVVCESSRKGYQRRLPHFPIYESESHDFQANSQIIEMTKNGELILTDNRHEHNWGSDSIRRVYRYNTALADFELASQEVTSSSGDGLRSDTYDIFFFSTNRYIRRSTCGGLEEGCKPQNSIGRIIPLKKKPTLYQANNRKPYKALIPD